MSSAVLGIGGGAEPSSASLNATGKAASSSIDHPVRLRKGSRERRRAGSGQHQGHQDRAHRQLDEIGLEIARQLDALRVRFREAGRATGALPLQRPSLYSRP